MPKSNRAQLQGAAVACRSRPRCHPTGHAAGLAWMGTLCYHYAAVEYNDFTNWDYAYMFLDGMKGEFRWNEVQASYASSASTGAGAASWGRCDAGAWWPVVGGPPQAGPQQAIQAFARPCSSCRRPATLRKSFGRSVRLHTSSGERLQPRARNGHWPAELCVAGGSCLQPAGVEERPTSTSSTAASCLPPSCSHNFGAVRLALARPWGMAAPGVGAWQLQCLICRSLPLSPLRRLTPTISAQGMTPPWTTATSPSGPAITTETAMRSRAPSRARSSVQQAPVSCPPAPPPRRPSIKASAPS